MEPKTNPWRGFGASATALAISFGVYEYIPNPTIKAIGLVGMALSALTTLYYGYKSFGSFGNGNQTTQEVKRPFIERILSGSNPVKVIPRSANEMDNIITGTDHRRYENDAGDRIDDTRVENRDNSPDS